MQKCGLLRIFSEHDWGSEQHVLPIAWAPVCMPKLIILPRLGQKFKV